MYGPCDTSSVQITKLALWLLYQSIITLIVCLVSHVWFFATLCTVACQAPLSVRFFRQEYWNGLHFPPPGHLPNPGIELMSLVSSALQADYFPDELSEKPYNVD